MAAMMCNQQKKRRFNEEQGGPATAPWLLQ
jgi:hypothetical protein